MTRHHLQLLYEQQRGHCAYCEQKVLSPEEAKTSGPTEYRTPTVDHVIPRSRGGVNNIANKVMACADCNTRKGNKLPDGEWYPKIKIDWSKIEECRQQVLEKRKAKKLTERARYLEFLRARGVIE